MARKHIMLWIFTLCVSPDPSVGHIRDIYGKKVYEVVRPIRLHELHKRDLESRPDTVKYAIGLGGRDIQMHLQRNDGILTKDYSEAHYTEDGTLVTTTPKDLDLCYYHGKIVNDSDSSVSMSTCDGLRGYFQTDEQRYLIEPLSENDDGDHAVFKYEAINEDRPMVCGVTNTSWDDTGDGFPPRISKSRSRSSGPTLFQQQKYIEFFLVADNREYKKMDSDLVKLRKRIFEIINFINNVYKEINTFVALSGFEAWTDSDKITVSPVAGATLDSFSNWRNSDLIKRHHHDNAQLLSAIDFDGATVGLAHTGKQCEGLSTGIVQDHNSEAIAVGATMAHEMGHNLGMKHDDSTCTCFESTCIMTAALSYHIPRHFSSCSTGQYEEFLNTKNPGCLLNMPKQKNLIQPALCGNRFVETGEECDCGTVQECTNPCCNAITCKLTKGSQCATGECCEKCKIMSNSHVCRPKNNECDLHEYCTGKSAECPEDVFTVNGLPCKNGKGYCYNGQCPMKEDQCIKMWGPTADVGKDNCYNYNTRGEYYAFCKRTPDKYIPCQNQDVNCGKLFCDKGNGDPNYGRLVHVGSSNCRATFYNNPEEDYGQVDTGTKCGEGMVCSQNECVDLETAFKATNCSAKCKGHGVCDHRLQCRCEPGWLPPDCETPADNGSSSVIAVVVCVLVVIALIALGIFLYKHRKRGPCSYSSSPSQGKFHVVNIPDYKHQRQPTPNQNPITIIKPTVPPPPQHISFQSRALHIDF